MVNQTVQLEPEQISRIIRSQIKYYQNAIEQTETGTVTMVGDGIARAAGLDNCMAGELVQFDSGTYGMAQNQADIFCSAFHIAAYFPPFASNSSWVPDSAILPSPITRIWSAFLTMERV